MRFKASRSRRFQFREGSSPSMHAVILLSYNDGRGEIAKGKKRKKSREDDEDEKISK